VTGAAVCAGASCRQQPCPLHLAAEAERPAEQEAASLFVRREQDGHASGWPPSGPLLAPLRRLLASGRSLRPRGLLGAARASRKYSSFIYVNMRARQSGDSNQILAARSAAKGLELRV